MAVADCNGLPVSVYVESATPHEVTLAMSTLLHLVVPDAPPNAGLTGRRALRISKVDITFIIMYIKSVSDHYYGH